MLLVRLSDAAKADLRAIHRFDVQTFGVRRSDAYLVALRATINMLGEFPQTGAIRAGMAEGIRVRPSGSHIIVYAVDDKTVRILRVRHTSEDWTSRPTGDRP